MKVLVTGAGGFVGRWLVPALRDAGHEVIGTRLPAEPPPEALAHGPQLGWVPLELRDSDSVRTALARPPEAVIHLAAVASGAEAGRDPGLAWEVNAAGTARLASELGRLREEGRGDPLFLLVSTAEVYGPAPERRPRTEDDAPRPVSPYAASKLGAEIAAGEVAARTGLRLIIARSFPHTGPGQTDRYALPAFARRLLAARRIGAPVVKTGNLEPVRDYLDVRDVVAAYGALLSRGTPGRVYNVASGQGHSLADIFTRLAALIGVRAIPEVDHALLRRSDLAHLVGNPARLRQDTGWTPHYTLDQTLQDLINAQTD